MEKLIQDLSTESEKNKALSFLENIVVDTDKVLIKTLSDIIDEPTSIEDTNRFASLLVFFLEDQFIHPLIKCILKATPGTSTWLADYMYALGNILRERDDNYPVGDDFVNLLGEWLLYTGGGEISWKSGIILEKLDNVLTRDYLLRGAKEQTLFHQTRIACIRGLVNNYQEDGIGVLEELLNDSDNYVREAVKDAQNWLKERSLEA